MKPEKPATPDEEPYAALLRDVPAVMREPLTRAHDAAAAREWLGQGVMPDDGRRGGVDDRRRHLEAISANANGKRWVRWQGDVYTNGRDDLDEFRADTELNEGPQGYNTTLKDRLAWRDQLAVIVGMPEQPDEDTFEMILPAGTFYAAVEYARLGETASYQGVYELKETV